MSKKIYKKFKKELAKGTKVELEEHKKVTHGKEAIAKQIAKDHIVGENIPDYYERLSKLEKKAKHMAKNKSAKKDKKLESLKEHMNKHRLEEIKEIKHEKKNKKHKDAEKIFRKTIKPKK